MPSLQRPGALLRQLGLDTVYLLLALPMGILTFTFARAGHPDWAAAGDANHSSDGGPRSCSGNNIPGVCRTPTGRFS